MSPDDIIKVKLANMLILTRFVDRPRELAVLSIYHLFRELPGLPWESTFPRVMSSSFAEAYFNENVDIAD
jgi:hypothetical protein